MLKFWSDASTDVYQNLFYFILFYFLLMSKTGTKITVFKAQKA